MATRRLNYLDSIRGVAAFLVVLHHCWQASIDQDFGLSAAFSSFPNFVHYMIGKVLAGRGAVIVFFVLSGFVLAHSMQKQRVSYAAFVIKRSFRIYPAFVFAVLCSYALHSAIGAPHRVNNEWLSSVVSPDLSTAILLKHLALWGTAQSLGLDNVIWSLVHEMRISLLFPLILLSVYRYRRRAVTAYWLLSVVCTLVSLYLTGQISNGYREATILGSLLATGFFVVFFAAGALLCIEREAVAGAITRLSHRKRLWLSVIVAVCLLKSEGTSVRDIASDYITGAGAFGLIAFALALGKFQSTLNHEIPVWFGRVSYSLYLIHLPILYALNQTIDGSWSFAPLATVTVLLSLAAADLMFRTIELPGIRLAKKLTTLHNRASAIAGRR